MSIIQPTNKVVPETDFLPVAQIRPEAGLQKGTITAAYTLTSKHGSKALCLVLKQGEVIVRHNLYYTSRADSHGNVRITYVRGGEEHYMPNYLLVRSIVELATRKSIDSVLANTTPKMISQWDKATASSKMVEVDMVPGLLTKTLLFGQVNVMEDRKSPKLNESTGKTAYVPTGEFFKRLNLKMVFAQSKHTRAEMIAKAPVPVFCDNWVKAYPADTLIDNSENKRYTKSLKAGTVDEDGAFVDPPQVANFETANVGGTAGGAAPTESPFDT